MPGTSAAADPVAEKGPDARRRGAGRL